MVAKYSSHVRRAPRVDASTSASARDGNRMLAALPRRGRARLASYLKEVMLARREVLFEPGCVPAHADLPHEGPMNSLVVPLRDGSTTEAVPVGLEGAAGIGVDATDPTMEAFTRGVVQMPGTATCLPAARMAEAAAASLPPRRPFSHHAEAAMSLALQSVARNAVHRVKARLARWLLMAPDRAGLKGAACECYAALRGRYERLLRPAGAGVKMEPEAR